jgi:adenylate kinase family enzyme
MLRDHTRIVVVGTSGCGKTTFARKLAHLTGLEHVETDALYWGPNWTRRSNFRGLIDAAVARDGWIIDGNYGEVRDPIWGRATALIWLDYSFHIIFGRAMARTVRRALTREPLFSDNRESLGRALFDREGIPWWVIRTFRRRRREYAALTREPRFSHIEFFRVATPKEAERLLGALD